jgi:colanic acid biosynthesis glycosyl transferase WcaI
VTKIPEAARKPDSQTSGADSDWSGRRILLVAANYAPDFAGIGPYATGTAEYFASLGAKVEVLTLMPHYPQWEVPEQYRRKLQVEEQVNGVTLRRIWNVISKRQTALTRAVFEASFLAHGAVRSGRERPDFVLAVVPSLGGAIAASLLAKRFGVPFGVVVQDLMGAAARQSGLPNAKGVAGIIDRGERWVLSRADGIVVICDAFRQHLLRSGIQDSRISVIRNWSHIERPSRDRTAVRQELGWDPSEFVVLHSGNMGHKQALESVVESARLAVTRMPKLRFVLMGDGSQRERLMGLAAGLPNVTFLPPKSKAEFPNVLGAADALLVNERSTMSDMSLPSKLTSYFAAGVPVLAAVPMGGTTALELEAAEAGLVVAPEKPEALVEGAERLHANATLRAELAERGLRHLEQHLTAKAALGAYARFVRELLPSSAVRSA